MNFLDEVDPPACPNQKRGPPTDYSLEACAHCDRGITIVAPSDDGTYDYIQLLCPSCHKLARDKGLCPTCWKRCGAHAPT